MERKKGSQGSSRKLASRKGSCCRFLMSSTATATLPQIVPKEHQITVMLAEGSSRLCQGVPKLKLLCVFLTLKFHTQIALSCWLMQRNLDVHKKKSTNRRTSTCRNLKMQLSLQQTTFQYNVFLFFHCN